MSYIGEASCAFHDENERSLQYDRKTLCPRSLDPVPVPPAPSPRSHRLGGHAPDRQHPVQRRLHRDLRCPAPLLYPAFMADLDDGKTESVASRSSVGGFVRGVSAFCSVHDSRGQI